MLQLPVYFTGYNRRKDRSVSLRFETQELSTEQLGEIDALVMEETFGNLLFKESAFQQSDIPTEDAEDTSKTPSKRLRAVIFVLWQQTGKPGDFEVFYRSKMEELCTRIKAVLD